MRKDYEVFIDAILNVALKTIVLEALEAESRAQDKHSVDLAKKYPDAIDVEYRVIEDGK